ncbi:hypothetical protein [Nannocystis pusilla]|uniref:hypothetical protein n=1 Tax=Nannocystis pusilla TaxID=889268 RepID=UPI003B7ACC77
MRPLVLVLFDPSACTPGAWAGLLRVVHAASEARLVGIEPLRNVPTTPPDPPFCLADPLVGWSFDRLRQGGPPAWQKQAAPLWERALRLGERAAAILGAAHAVLGVPHRALVPQRLVVTEADELLILDFGVGELEPSAGRPDDCGYRAPEQAKARGDVRSDVHSLASVLFELIAGERPSPRMPARLRSLVPGCRRPSTSCSPRRWRSSPGSATRTWESCGRRCATLSASGPRRRCLCRRPWSGRRLRPRRRANHRRSTSRAATCRCCPARRARLLR